MLFKELDQQNTGQLHYTEFLKPSWGNVHTLLNNTYSKMQQLSSDAYKDAIQSVSSNLLDEDCPPSFLCPITQEIMVNPVLLLDTGSTYERRAIETWLQTKNTDPTSGVVLKNKTLVPILSLKNAIEEWKQQQLLRKQQSD
eukprot:TRINITY_DN3662_c0_g1_i1.p1 TRINITY_DN3662_c0_g1~~TRINITY_DN3662_c0_g1_i1.p1  ORF type:complete len:141 (-),score=31.01 TRINITY_DN3662_c0_g1_i1:124-546(-)